MIEDYENWDELPEEVQKILLNLAKMKDQKGRNITDLDQLYVISFDIAREFAELRESGVSLERCMELMDEAVNPLLRWVAYNL